jgi:hypothetical protein
MDENAGKSPDQLENAECQNRPKPDEEEAPDDFACAPDAQAMTSSSADTAKDEPGQVAPEPTKHALRPRSPRLTVMAASIATAAALGSLVGSLTASGVTQFWPRRSKRPKCRYVGCTGAQCRTCGIVHAQDVRRRRGSERQ